MQLNYKVIVTESGQQIPVQTGEGIQVSVIIEGDNVKEEIPLDTTNEEFKELQDMAVTNDIPTAILMEKKAL